MSGVDSVFDLQAISAHLAFGASREQIQAALTRDVTAPLVVQAPAGSGKTTIVPPTVANALAHAEVPGRVIVTQPRRLAARAAARRLASLDGSRLGERVGFSVRGESRVSRDTRVEFVTAGLFLRRLLADPDLDGVAAVIVDEVHERSIETDMVLAMVNQVSQLRDDLAFLVMSATLHAQELAGFLRRQSEAEVITGHSIQHPVAEEFAAFSGIRNAERGLEHDYLRHIARTAVSATASNNAQGSAHDTLVFVPGAGEVDKVVQMVEAQGRFMAHALHARIPTSEQDAVLSTPKEEMPPRIIVATSIAESSLTVPRVNLVIDSGYAREPRRDALRGMSGLVTVVASRASAIQRAGRAGRLGPGKVVRTLDPKSFAAATAYITPELRTADLVQAALYLAAWGTPRAEGLQMWQAPPGAALDDAEEVLRALGAIDDSGQITATGQKLVRIPADPRIARALLDGAGHFGSSAAAQCVALLSSNVRIAGADAHQLLNQLRGSQHPAHRAWQSEAERFGKLVPHAAESRAKEDAHGALAGVVALAYPQWVGRRVGVGEYLLASGTRAQLPRESTLAEYPFLAVADVGRVGSGAMIRLAAGIELAQLIELLPQLHRNHEQAEFHAGKVSARRVETLGAIELAATPIKVSRKLGTQAVHAALEREGLALFGEQPDFEALRARLALAHRFIGAPFTPVDDQSLVRRHEQWLEPELTQLASGTPAARINLVAAAKRLIPWEHAHDFASLVPERLAVPSGSRIRIQYPPVGDRQGRVVVAVKLQECFGLAVSPRLIRDQVPIQFHLLSPAGSPLAVTDDLASFWNGPYAQVRSEMRGRYPKHPWPENPWEHVATAKTKKRLR